MTGAPQRLAIVSAIVLTTLGLIALLSSDETLHLAGAVLLMTSASVTFWFLSPRFRRRGRNKPKE